MGLNVIDAAKRTLQIRKLVAFPTSRTVTDERAFYVRDGLRKLIFPGGFHSESICKEAFESESQLIQIEDAVFPKCSSPKSISIPKIFQ
jgi:hypothetical protein